MREISRLVFIIYNTNESSIDNIIIINTLKIAQEKRVAIDEGISSIIRNKIIKGRTGQYVRDTLRIFIEIVKVIQVLLLLVLVLLVLVLVLVLVLQLQLLLLLLLLLLR